jgi:ABC-2 type transport system ATP-binding protein
VVPSAELNGVKEAFRVSSTARRSDGVHVRVLTEHPPQGAQPAMPTLEDAYRDALALYRAGAQK